MFELGAVQVALASLAIFAGALVQGAVGFGSALIAAPLLALIDTRFVPGPIIVATFVLTVLIAVRERASLDLTGVTWAIVGRIPGTALGLLMLLAMPAQQLALLFSAMVLLGVALVASGLHVHPTRVTLACAGLLSGVMGTVASIGGPPIALLYHHKDGPTLRGTLSGYFTFSTTITIVALSWAGQLDAARMELVAILLPGTVLGFLASRAARHVLDRGYTRPAVLAISGCAAVSLLVKTLL